MANPSSSAHDFDWTSRRVLVVDRDDQFRFWARGLFKHQRIGEVLTAPWPSEAQTILRRHAIGAALLELGHDEGAALHFLRWVRDPRLSPCPELPVLLLVGAMDKELLRLACGYGIHGVLRKPVSGDLILRAVSAVLRNPRKLTWGAQDGPVAAPTDAGEPAKSAAISPRPSRTAPSAGVFVPPEGKSLPIGAVPAGSRGTGRAEVAGLPERPKRGGEPIELAEPPPQRPKDTIELIEVAEPPPADDRDWAEALAEGQKRKKRRDADQGIELAPAAKAPEAATGIDLDKILADHADWVRSAGAAGTRAALEGQDLSGRSLAEALLTNAVLRRCDLSAGDFTGAQMQGADLRHAEIIGATLTGCNLAVARLRHARLRGCRFDQANLKGADLAGADLAGVRMPDADLAGANLLGVDLSGADLSAATGLTQGQLESVIGDTKTRLPPGLFLPAPKER